MKNITTLRYLTVTCSLVIFSAFTFAQLPATGEVQGVFNVSDIGAANYTIPIKAPDGIAGLQPAVSLAYNSQGGNGIMGMGWSIAGLSAITRVGRNIYHDKATAGVELSANDRFALNGNRLILTSSGNYGGANTQYRTEIESYNTIKANGTLGSGPQSFTVTDQEGKVYEYGTVANARATIPGKSEPYMWLLNKVTDLNGNQITYHYTNSPGNEVLISAIRYNIDPNMAPNYKSYINFIYENRPDPNFKYLAGVATISSKRLKKVSAGQWDGYWKYFRSYDLNYETDTYTHLISINENGKNQDEAFPETTFDYGPATSGYQTAVVSSGNFSVAHEFVTGDYNGDGKSDAIQFTKNYTPSSNIWNLYLSTGTTFSLTQTGNLPPSPSDYTENKKLPVNRDYAASFFDFNGDGKEDFVYRSKKPLPSTQVEHNLYHIMLSNGSSLTTLPGGQIIPSLNDDYIGGFNFFNTYPLVGDYDGDGKSEILVLKYTDNYTATDANYLIGENYLKPYGSYLLAKQLHGMPFDATFIEPNISVIGKPKLMVIDYNGDGKHEILSIWLDQVTNISHAQVYQLNVYFDANNKPVVGNPAFVMVNDTEYPTVWHDVYPGDFNGDGATDLLTWISGAGWEIGYSRGNGWMNDIRPAPPLGGQPMFGNEFRPIVIADYNGDGKSDIFNYAPTVYSSTWGYTPPVMWYSKGNHQFVNESLASMEPTTGVSPEIYWLGDYTGDGQTDFLTIKDWSGAYPLRRFSFRPNDRRHLLSKITTGLGEQTKINYLPLTSSTVYQPGTNTYTYPFVKRTIPFKVVSSVNIDNGINTTGNNITYSYTGLKFNLHGKGLLGFDKVKSYDQINALTTEKTFALNTTYAFPYMQKVESYQGNYVLNRVTSTYGVRHFGNKRIFPYLSTTEKSDFVTNQFSREEYKYTAPAGTQPHGYNLGKPNSVIVRNGYTLGSAPAAPVQLDLSETVYKYPDLPNSLPIHLKSKPYSVITSTTRQGHPAYTRQEDYTYYPATGLVNTIVSDPSTVNQLTTTLSYDGYGNLTSKSRYTPGWAARTEAFTYDPSHRYVAESWNTAYPNVKTTTTYDPVLGLPLTVTNPDGFTTTYTYDAFGRVKARADNNGGLDSTIYGDGGAINRPINARYVVTNKSNTGAVNYDYYDRLGRQIRTGSKEFNGSYVFTDRVYNTKGQLYQESQPYLWGVMPEFSTYTYDVRGRLIKEARPEGDNTLSYLIVGNNYQVTATNAAGQTKVTQTDKSGKTVRVEDEGGALTYSYHSNGGVLQTALNGNPVLINEYDAWGRRVKETDPNYGTYEYTFNGHGELYNKKDPKGNSFHFNYNRRGDMFQRGGPDGVFDLYYHYGTGPNSGKLIQINQQASSSPLRIVYDHGMGDQLKYEARITGSDTFKNSYTYDQVGRLNGRIYPNDQQINYFYSGNGDLAGAFNLHSYLGLTILYNINAKNPFGQPYSITHGQAMYMGYPVAETFQGYNTLGFLVSQSSTSGVSGLEIRNSTYDFDVTTGNLNERLDNVRNKKESFLFDDLNRLEKSRRENLSPPSMMQDIDLSYADNGNILSKTDAGSFSYDVANRISEVDPYVDVSEATQTLSYTGFNKVAQIDEGSKAALFSYWPDEERSKMEVSDSGAVKKIKYYAPDYEKELIILPNGDTIIRELCYVTGPNGYIMAILERKDGVDKPYYTLTDYLGSITHIIDQDGNLVEERSFDAWGRRRDPDTWMPLPATWGSLTDASWDRGYTGHEQLPQFGIINMNGRLYDPVMGRMFSPDPYIMGTDNTQGYNRYTYALNNPLTYTDPSGEWLHIALGALVGGVVNLGVKAFQGKIDSWGDGLMAFGIGAAAGAIGAATGGAAFLGAGGSAAIGSGGAIAGMAGGLYGSAMSMPVQGIGNTLYFGDAPLTAKEWALGSLMGMGLGGVTNGALAALNGRNILTGKFPKVNLSKISAISQPQSLSRQNNLQFSPREMESSFKPNSIKFNTVKNINYEKVYGKLLGHGMSKKHLSDGLLKIGNSRIGTADYAIKVIEQNQMLLQNGPNQIIVNGGQFTVRVFAENGTVISANMFSGTSNRMLGNIIYFNSQ